MRRLSTLVGLTLFVSLLAGIGPATAWTPQPGTGFNTPVPWAGKSGNYAIISRIIHAMNHVSPTAKDPKPTILVTSYLMDYRPAVDAMIGACKRGVGVRVILDQDVKNHQSRRLITALNSDNVKDANHDGKADAPAKNGPCNTRKRARDARGRLIRDQRGRVVLTDPNKLMTGREAVRSVSDPLASKVTWGRDRSYVKRCDGACRGGMGNMHAKMYLFSHSGTAHDVVMVSSSNLNRGGARAGWNDLFVMNNRPKSFLKYATIHRQMTADDPAPVSKVEVDDGPYVSRFFPMRHATKANDPTLKDLNKIGCHSAYGRTQVAVSMFYWKGTRGTYLANKLLDLAHNGCHVSAIYGAPSRAIAAKLRTAAANHVIDLYDSRWDFNDDGYNEVRTHAKFVLVKGTIGTNHKAHAVWTGTQNWVAGSLSKGDENSLDIAGGGPYTHYVHDWITIRNHSRRLPYSQYR